MKPTALVLSGWGPYKGVERADFEAMQRGVFLISGCLLYTSDAADE